MKKTVQCLVLFLLICSVVFAAGAKDSGTAKVGSVNERLIRFGTASASTSDVVKAMNLFAEKVATASGGKIKVEIFPGSTLGDPKQMTQNAQLGALDMCLTTPAVLSDMGAKKFMVLNLPYIFKNNDHSWKVLEGAAGKEILDSLKGLRIVGIGYYKDGARNFFTKTPVRKIEDLKGLKIRVQPTQMDTDMATALGISPTPIEFSELFSALQTGVVVGAENPIAGYYNGKYYEVCKYLTLDEHSNPPVVVVFSELVWNQLSEKEKELIKTAWADAQNFNKENVIKSQQALIASLQSQGIEVIQISDKDKWISAMNPVYKKYAVGFEDLIQKIASVQ